MISNKLAFIVIVGSVAATACSMPQPSADKDDEPKNEEAPAEQTLADKLIEKIERGLNEDGADAAVSAQIAAKTKAHIESLGSQLRLLDAFDPNDPKQASSEVTKAAASAAIELGQDDLMPSVVKEVFAFSATLELDDDAKKELLPLVIESAAQSATSIDHLQALGGVFAFISDAGVPEAELIAYAQVMSVAFLEQSKVFCDAHADEAGDFSANYGALTFAMVWNASVAADVTGFGLELADDFFADDAAVKEALAAVSDESKAFVLEHESELDDAAKLDLIENLGAVFSEKVYVQFPEIYAEVKETFDSTVFTSDLLSPEQIKSVQEKLEESFEQVVIDAGGNLDDVEQDRKALCEAGDPAGVWTTVTLEGSSESFSYCLYPSADPKNDIVGEGPANDLALKDCTELLALDAFDLDMYLFEIGYAAGAAVCYRSSFDTTCAEMSFASDSVPFYLNPYPAAEQYCSLLGLPPDPAFGLDVISCAEVSKMSVSELSAYRSDIGYNVGSPICYKPNTDSASCQLYTTDANNVIPYGEPMYCTTSN